MSDSCGFDSGYDTGFCTDVKMRGVPSLRPGPKFRRLRAVPLEGRGLIPVIARGRLTIHRNLKAKARIVVEGRGLLSLEQHPTGPAILEPAAVARLTLGVTLEGKGDAESAQATGELRTRVALSGTGVLPMLAASGALHTIPFVYTPKVIELAGEAILPATISSGVLTMIPAVYVPALVELAGEMLEIGAVSSGCLRSGRALSGAGVYAVTASGRAAVGQALEGWADFETDALGEVMIDDEQTALALLGLPSEVVLGA